MRKLPLRYATAIGLNVICKRNYFRFITHLGIPHIGYFLDTFRKKAKRPRRNFYKDRQPANKNYIKLRNFRHMYFFIRQAHSPYHKDIYPYIQKHVHSGLGPVYRPHNPYEKFYRS